MKIFKDILCMIVLAAVTGLTVNALSPSGIALVGDWNPENGVISARAKNQPVSHDIEIPTVAEAYALFNDKNVLFVDARDVSQYDEGHIKGAVSLFVYEYGQRFPEFMAKVPLDRPIVAYCSGRSCEDSHTLARYLKEDGYTDVRVFVDGFPAWAEEGHPVEKTR